MGVKCCNTCGCEKPLAEFHRDSAKKDGHRNICKACQKAERHASYAANRDKVREQVRTYNQRKKAAGERYWSSPEAKARARYREWMKSGKAPRYGEFALHDEHVKQRAPGAGTDRARVLPPVTGDHDAHVRRFRDMERHRQYWRERGSLLPNVRGDRVRRRKRDRDDLADPYILRLLTDGKRSTAPVWLPQSLVDVKREHLRLVRLLKERRNHDEERDGTADEAGADL